MWFVCGHTNNAVGPTWGRGCARVSATSPCTVEYRGFPHPLIEREAAATGLQRVNVDLEHSSNEIKPSKGKGPLDHSSIAQSWRGVWSGRARRRETQARDRAIIQAVERGASMRAVASEHGITARAVHRIVWREFNLTTSK